ncbi:PIG-L family deacetylase [Streptomyces sp. NBC_01218]|uniref:PIG-L deacetylase family protein n=1 Tax=Streptomyces sp. NBC_01218 TaxID=2903780 RepID=UPI002E1394C0|nr:PIG-L family deacetylase [Streptomyces sp. NBC_01218]
MTAPTGPDTGAAPRTGPDAAAGRERAAALLRADGTSEAEWARWDGWKTIGTAPRIEGPVVVVAAHPDDEVLGVGGTLARLTAAGTEVHVVTVTDGEASHPGSRRVPPEALARLRAEELAVALDDLGVDRGRRTRLGVPDTRVDAYEDEVAGRLADAVRAGGARLCLAPWTGDLHADHEAAGRAARTAARDTGAALWYYPVWTWHWAAPGDARVPWDSVRRLPLTAGEQARKARAISRFRTQTAPLADDPDDPTVILPPAELLHHRRPFEVILL